MTGSSDRTATSDQGVGDDAGASFDRVLDVLNSGMLALIISVGDQTGLFRTMQSLPPSTSAQIAAAAGLHERYVREWLAAVTAGGIVTHDPVTMTFALPPTYAMALSRGVGGPWTLAGAFRHVAMLGKVEDQIVEHFRRGGGVPYETYKERWAWTAEAPLESYELADVDPLPVDSVLSLVPGITDRLSEGIEVADVGCGWGMQLNLLASRYPNSRFVGFELYEAAELRAARHVADQNGLTNVQFRQKDATTLDGAERFDLVLTFDAIHDQARPDLALQGIARSLRSDGVYVAVDVSGSSTLANNLDDPLNVFKYTWSVMHCMSLSLAYGGMGLGTYWGEELARKMMMAAGFTTVETKHLPEDLFNCYHICSVAEKPDQATDAAPS